MSESLDRLREEAKTLSLWRQHRFIIMIFGAALTAVIFTSVALHLYSTSTASELDLSLPSRQAILRQSNSDAPTMVFPSSGIIDQKALEKFRTMYSAQLEKATGTNAFDSAAMSDRAIELPVIK